MRNRREQFVNIIEYFIINIFAIAACLAFYYICGPLSLAAGDHLRYAALSKYVFNHLALWSYIPYSDFKEVIAAGRESFNYVPQIYPNYLFMYAVGFVGFLRGGIYDINSSLIWSLLCTVIAGNLLWYLIRRILMESLAVDKRWKLAASVCAFFLIYSSRLFYTTVTQPLSDTSLFLFFILAVIFVNKDKYIYAGLSLGMGFLFRSQAVMFIPILPFLCFKSLTPRKYLKISGVLLLFMTIFYCSDRLIFKILTSFLSMNSYYDTQLGLMHYNSKIIFSMAKHLAFFLSHKDSYKIGYAYVLCTGILFSRKVIAAKELSVADQCVVFALSGYVIQSFFVSYLDYLPTRYFIYYVPFIYSAIILYIFMIPFDRLDAILNEKSWAYFRITLLTLLIAFFSSQFFVDIKETRRRYPNIEDVYKKVIKTYSHKYFDGVKYDKGNYVLVLSLDTMFGVYYFADNAGAYEGRVVVDKAKGFDFINQPYNDRFDYLLITRPDMYPMDNKVLNASPEVIIDKNNNLFRKVMSDKFLQVWEKMS